mmetsp:Transcript_7776/g.13661  ORF Transcript_7776/g.13661 Transcript_7776/m.13661 type:complete len:275 (+) Transcript_7776:25563-26387(+)
MQSESDLHWSPVAQGWHKGPPQSRSVSFPLSFPSLHVKGRHNPLSSSQDPLAQSLSMSHIVPSSHGVHFPPHLPLHEGSKHLWWVSQHTKESQSASELHAESMSHSEQSPPQSTSLSRPFNTLSAQDAERHLPSVPSHIPLRQSSAVSHSAPAGHLGQRPPQSTSDSSKLSTPSKQVMGMQAPRSGLHFSLIQSPSCTQSAPSLHGSQSAPPQSTDVSCPSSSPFRQVSAIQVPERGEHSPERQSVDSLHMAPTLHRAHWLDPPQSTSASSGPN